MPIHNDDIKYKRLKEQHYFFLVVKVRLGPLHNETQRQARQPSQKNVQTINLSDATEFD
jgi:hypothetical protein